MRAGESSIDYASANDDLVEALLLNGRGSAPETLALAERTLRLKESILGPDDRALTRSIANVGDTLVAAGKYDAAIAALQRAVALDERIGPDTVDVAETLDRLGSALIANGRFEAALTALERSARIKEQRLDPQGVKIAETLERLGYSLQRKGEYERAAEPVRRADRIRDSLSPDDPARVQTLNLVAQQLWFEGQLRGSMTTSERALSLAERTLRPDHPLVARTLRLLAGTVEDLGDFDRAHTLRDRALAIVEREFGPQHYETAVYLNSAAMSDLSRGAYPEARARLERAIRMFEAQFGPSHDYVATTRLNLAIVDANLGDYVGAGREQSRATAIWERTLGRNHPFVAEALTELAIALREQGSAAQALPLLERALSIRQRALGPAHRDVAVTRTELAAAYAKMGNTRLAQDQAAQALRIWQQLDEPDSPEFAAALMLAGELQLKRGALVDAKAYYDQALAIRTKAFGRRHPAFADAQIGLALTLAAAGQLPPATSAAAEAEEVSRDHLRLMLAHLPERQSLNYAATRPKGLDLLLSLAGSTPDGAALALDEAIRSRALVLDEMAARRGSAAGATPAAPLAAKLASARQRLANLVVRGPGEMPVARFAALVDEARSESELVEAQLAEQSAEFRAEMTRARIGLAEVTAAVEPDTALVSFVRYTRFTFRGVSTTGAAAPGGSLSAVREVPSYVALLIRPGFAPVAIPLGSAASIDARISEWRAAVAAGAAAPAAMAAQPSSSRVSGAALRQAIWDPLAGRLKETARVFIVPDGALSLVPFAALPVGQRSYLVESGPVIHYLSAERDLVSTPRATRGPDRLLAIGAPAFDARPPVPVPPSTESAAEGAPATRVRGVLQPCSAFQATVFPPLEGTLREVREVSFLWNSRAAAEAEPAHVLVGRQATETALKQEAHRYRILHIATHGFFLGDDCSTGAAGSRGVGGLVSPRRPVAENPLLLSGVLLAGANRRAAAKPGEDDGVLTAEEVASLDLGDVEWAVLSACDTGVGAIRPGEGVFGLRRAFQIAGARTVVMSLWSVEDQATRAWMRALYEGRLRNRLSTAEAVRRASLEMLRERRASGRSTEPFYWAAFVAAGDWR